MPDKTFNQDLRVLHLNLHREFFDEIVRGEKLEEFRDRIDHWKARLDGREYDIIRFTNGYGPDVPEMDVEWKGVKKRFNKYAIQLGKVLSIRRWPPP